MEYEDYDDYYEQGDDQDEEYDDDLHGDIEEKPSQQIVIKRNTSNIQSQSKRVKNKYGEMFLLQSDVYDDLMFKLKQNIMDLICLNLEDSLLVFHYYNWSIGNLQSKYFEDLSKVQKNLGINKEQEITSQSKEKPQFQQLKMEKICNLCCCESDEWGYCKQGHGFCTDCWKGYVLSNMKEQQPFFRCMQEKCTSYVKHTFILQILGNQAETYKKVLGKAYIEGNKNIRYCPAPDCQYAGEKIEGMVLNSTTCLCGTEFCFRCGQLSHYPSSCVQRKEFLDMMNRDDANLAWIIANAKTCPFCHRAVERSMGCNYIMCSPPCSKSFCYICEQPWENDSDGTHHRSKHMNCNTYEAQKQSGDNSVSQKEKQQKMLEKISFYVGKYKDCERSIAVIQKSKIQLVEPIRKILFDKLHIDLMESQFFHDAFEILMASRSTLQWSYAFCYFFSADQVKTKALFEEYQQMFAGHCEQLAILLSNDFTLYSKSVQETDFQKAFQQNLLPRFNELKNRISQLSNSIKNTQRALLDSVDSGSVFLD